MGTLHAAAAACAVLAASLLLWKLAHVVALAIAAAVVAAAMDLVVRRLVGPRLRRGVAIALAYVGALAILGIVLFVAARALGSELPDLATALARAYARLRAWLVAHPRLIARALGDRLPPTSHAVDLTMPAVATTGASLRVLGDAAWLLLLAVFWSYGGRQLEDAVSALLPERWRHDALRAWRGSIARAGRAFAGQAATVVWLFIVLFFAFRLLGLRYGAVIATLTAGAHLIPFVGPFCATAIAIGCGASLGPWQALGAGAAALAAVLWVRRLAGPRVHPFLLAFCSLALLHLGGLPITVLAPSIAAAVAYAIHVIASLPPRHGGRMHSHRASEVADATAQTQWTEDDAQVSHQGLAQGRAQHARDEARQAALGTIGQEGHEPQAGDRDRPEPGAARGRARAQEEAVSARGSASGTPPAARAALEVRR